MRHSEQAATLLGRGERRQPRGKPWFDPAPFVVPLFEAVLEGRPYSVLPAPDVERADDQEQAYRCCMQEADRMAARIEQDDLRGAERFRAEVEKKRQPKMRKLEKEQEARRDG